MQCVSESQGDPARQFQRQVVGRMCVQCVLQREHGCCRECQSICGVRVECIGNHDGNLRRENYVVHGVRMKRVGNGQIGCTCNLQNYVVRGMRMKSVSDRDRGCARENYVIRGMRMKSVGDNQGDSPARRHRHEGAAGCEHQPRVGR